MSLLRNRITAVVAGSVVVVGIGATGAVAGTLITSAQIEDGTIRSADIKDDTVHVRDLRAGAVNRLSADSGSELIVGAGYTSTWKAGEAGETIETCPEGQYAIGGGYSTWGGKYDLGGDNRNIQVTVSAPYFQGEYEPVDEAGNFRADQWVVRGFNNGDTDQIVRAWVVCSNLAD